MIDVVSQQDNSSLRQLIEKPPMGGKELLLLNQLQLAGFRLHPGPLPEQYRTLLNQVGSSKEKKAKNKKNKKHRGGGSETPAYEESGRAEEDREKRREKKHKK